MIDRFPPRYLIPNSITGVSLIMALASILASGRAAWEWAAWLVVWCALLDRVDGVVARAVRATSEFGVQFDTLADLLAFCVAPVLFVYLLLTQDPRYAPIYAGASARVLLQFAAGAYVLCGALRLSRFNVQASAVGPGWSRGLPVTIAGGLVTTFVLAAWHVAWPAAVAIVPLLLLVLSGFMISNLWLPKSLGPRRPSLIPWQALGVIGVYALGCARRGAAILFLVALAYPVIGFVAGALHPPSKRSAA